MMSKNSYNKTKTQINVTIDPGGIRKGRVMKIMKEFYEKIKAEIEENQEPVEPPEIEGPVEPSDEVKEFIYHGVCLSCGSLETLMRREIVGELVIKSYHCSGCKNNWTVQINLETQMTTYGPIETNWVDLWNQQDAD